MVFKYQETKTSPTFFFTIAGHRNFTYKNLKVTVVALIFMYSRATNQIKITVYPIYLENQSEPNDNHYVLACRVKIENLEKEIIQLRTRCYRITDSLGRIQKIQRVGVVG